MQRKAVMITYEGEHRPHESLNSFWATQVEMGGTHREVNDTCPVQEMILNDTNEETR
jgi:hypothetical protein